MDQGRISGNLRQITEIAANVATEPTQPRSTKLVAPVATGVASSPFAKLTNRPVPSTGLSGAGGKRQAIAAVNNDVKPRVPPLRRNGLSAIDMAERRRGRVFDADFNADQYAGNDALPNLRTLQKHHTSRPLPLPPGVTHRRTIDTPIVVSKDSGWKVNSSYGRHSSAKAPPTKGASTIKQNHPRPIDVDTKKGWKVSLGSQTPESPHRNHGENRTQTPPPKTWSAGEWQRPALLKGARVRFADKACQALNLTSPNADWSEVLRVNFRPSLLSDVQRANTIQEVEKLEQELEDISGNVSESYAKLHSLHVDVTRYGGNKATPEMKAQEEKQRVRNAVGILLKRAVAEFSTRCDALLAELEDKKTKINTSTA
jgi:uncharacterized protein (UPF0335 family)